MGTNLETLPGQTACFAAHAGMLSGQMFTAAAGRGLLETSGAIEFPGTALKLTTEKQLFIVLHSSRAMHAFLPSVNVLFEPLPKGPNLEISE